MWKQQETSAKLTIHMTNKAVWAFDCTWEHQCCWNILPPTWLRNAVRAPSSVCLAMHGNKVLCLLTAPKSNSPFWLKKHKSLSVCSLTAWAPLHSPSPPLSLSLSFPFPYTLNIPFHLHVCMDFAEPWQYKKRLSTWKCLIYSHLKSLLTRKINNK